MGKAIDLKDEIHKSRARLQTLLDQVRVKIHLGGMDARDALRGLEEQAEEVGHGITEATKLALADVNDRLERLSDRLVNGSDAQRR
jgi:hypothetical protein